MNAYTYEINGKSYYQRKLTWGQIQLLTATLEGLTVTSFAPMALVKAMGDRLVPALAAILVPVGCADIGSRDLKTIERELANADFEDLMVVIEDFFACNQTSSILGSLGRLLEKILVTPSNELSPDFQEEISSNDGISSGQPAQTSAAHT